jgi:hypothetical protein
MAMGNYSALLFGGGGGGDGCRHPLSSSMFLIYFESCSSKSSRKIKKETKESLSNNRFFYFLSQTFASAGSRHLHYGKLCGWATEYIASLYTLVYIGASCCCRPKSFRHFLCCAAAVRRLISVWPPKLSFFPAGHMQQQNRMK